MENFTYLTNTIVGSTRHDEHLLLASFAARVKAGGLILDIGTCEGRTAFALAMGSHESVTVVTIDPTPSPRFYEHRKALGLEKRVEIITQKSQEVPWSKPIDMFFNDGLHQYQGIVDDNKIYCPYVVKGGWCLFHDYTLYSNTVGRGIEEGIGKYYQRVGVIDNIFIGTKL